MVALDDTYGAVLIGVVLAAVLYGFTCVQTWYYYTHYPSDPWYNKLLVLATFVSDTSHQALITHALYTYVITYFGQFDELANIVWSIIAEVLSNCFTTLFVQCFLTMRVWKLSNKNRFMTGLILMLVIAEFILSVVFGIQALRFKSWAQLKSLKALSMAINAAAAVGDTVIAVYLCYLLHNSRTGFRRSDTIIKKLILFSINTGLLTSVCALASLVSYSAWPNTFIYITFYFCIGRLYCNSLLATLNARKGLKGQINTSDMTLSFQGRTERNRSGLGGSSAKRMPNNISIKIDTTQELVRDEYSSSSGDVKDSVVV